MAINGTSASETLYGTSGADTINGQGGNDNIKGGGGADTIDGGTGFDMVFYSDSTAGVSVNLATGRGIGGTAEGDTFVNVEAVWGSSFNDTLTGNDGINDLYGNDGNDVLKGGGGADGLDGGSGNDILKGGGGADYLAGGAGTDTADYSGSAAVNGTMGVFVNLQDNLAYYGEAEGDTFSSIENVTGSAYDDYLTGTDVANGFRGNDGNDTFFALGGNDVLDGGNGNDILEGGAGADTMTGGAGDDTYYVDNAADVINDLAGQGRDAVYVTASYALAAANEIEYLYSYEPQGTAALNLSGNDFGQFIMGTDGGNVLRGFGGADTLDARGGFDQLFGGDGADILTGGGGPDDLIGGLGADMFVYFDMSDTGTVPGTFDVIHDFNKAEGDVINVSPMDSNPLIDGVQHWTFVGGAPLTAPGQISVANDGVDTLLLFNTDTDGAAEAVIKVGGLQPVDAGWFLLA
jgi:Ca2+-binding RTX toxin-like protein